MGKATQDLRNEHDAILHVLKIVDKVVSTDMKVEADELRFGTELVYFLKIFADKCHHGKEEDHLFAAMINKGIGIDGGPIGVMLQEHTLGRELIARMTAALEAKDLVGFKTNAASYSALLKGHIGKENDILFVMADQVLDDGSQSELFEKFENHEERVVGHGVHDQLHSMIDRWEAEFGVI